MCSLSRALARGSWATWRLRLGSVARPGARCCPFFMFEEGQLYAPVTREGADVTVHLADDHPGVRRSGLPRASQRDGRAALDWSPEAHCRSIPYTEAEHDVWREVPPSWSRSTAGSPCLRWLQRASDLSLPEDHIPQLTEVNDLLAPHTGFCYQPAAGLVPLMEFYGALADRLFYSTQYVRHHRCRSTPPSRTSCTRSSVTGPLPRPRPVRPALPPGRGRGSTGADDRGVGVRLQGLLVLPGVRRGARRWRGAAYGAGLLSSYGEIQQVAPADLRPLNIARMGVQTYDITHYQPILFCGDGFGAGRGRGGRVLRRGGRRPGDGPTRSAARPAVVRAADRSR